MDILPDEKLSLSLSVFSFAYDIYYDIRVYAVIDQFLKSMKYVLI